MVLEKPGMEISKEQSKVIQKDWWSRAVTECPSKCDAMSSLNSEASGLSFGHVLHEDASQAEKNLWQMFEKTGNQRKTNVTRNSRKNMKRTLNTFPIKVYKRPAYFPLDTCTFPHLISLDLTEQIGHAAPQTIETISVADKTMLICRGEWQTFGWCSAIFNKIRFSRRRRLFSSGAHWGSRNEKPKRITRFRRSVCWLQSWTKMNVCEARTRK